MTNADPLIAAFRQLATGKASSRLGSPGGTVAKENSDKAAHFREQLRSVAKGANPEPKAELPKEESAKAEFAKAEVPRDEIKAGKQDLLRALELPDHVAEVADEGTPQNGRADQRNETPPPPQAAADATPLPPPDWRGPEASLSAVISRLDQAQTSSARDDAVTAHVALPESRAEPREIAPDLDLDAPVNVPKADEAPEQRFTLTVDTADAAPENRRPDGDGSSGGVTASQCQPGRRRHAGVPGGRQAGPDPDPRTGSAEPRRGDRQDAPDRQCGRDPPFGGSA
jgi:chemotaxis protein MotD